MTEMIDMTDVLRTSYVRISNKMERRYVYKKLHEAGITWKGGRSLENIECPIFKNIVVRLEPQGLCCAMAFGSGISCYSVNDVNWEE